MPQLWCIPGDRQGIAGPLKRSSLTIALLCLFACVAAALCIALAAYLLRHAATPHAFPSEATSLPIETALQLRLTVSDTTHALERTRIPALDPYDVARRLRHAQGPFLQAIPESPVLYSLGDHDAFWVLNLDPVDTFQVSATLRHVSPHLYMWVQDDAQLPKDALEQSARTFEEHLYPTVRQSFGTEWIPGIDNDVRLTILHARFSGAAAYFSSENEYPRTVMPHSNQREMLYVNLEAMQPGTSSYDATLAHEFQHIVHWFSDSNEDTWVNEGASELAVHLCGYSQDDRVSSFTCCPDTQLTHWVAYPSDAAAHYGAAFLFLTYFHERLGPATMLELVTNQLNGVAGFASVLEAHQTGLTFDDLFADWVVTNYADGRTSAAAGTPYRYRELNVQAEAERVISSYPAEGRGTVHQYAADYIELAPARQDLRLTFAGMPTTRLVPNQPHSGRYQWWSNRGDNSDMTLTRSFDLRGLKKATLQAWLWHDIERGWDYAYVEASADGGATWHILPGKHSTIGDPTGDSYGPAYTGSSSASDADPERAEWVQETFDLSPFAGHRTLVRFEYLTDDAINGGGFCVDDIRIPELEYSHDAENGDDGWKAEGFIRCESRLPQRYIIQVIRFSDEITVERPWLHADETGSLIIPALDQSSGEAILAISAATPGSIQAAPYRYEIQALN